MWLGFSLGCPSSGPSATAKNLDQLPRPSMLLDPGPGSNSPQGPAHQSPGKALSACNGTPGWGHAPSHRQSTQQRAWGWVSLPLSPQIDSLLGLPLCNPRIGHTATLLVQLLLFAILGVSTAFVPSFELYVVLCFSVAAAVAGYTFSNVTLHEYLGPEAISCRARPWGLRGHTPTVPGGPSQLRAPNVMALTRPELDQDHSP